MNGQHNPEIPEHNPEIPEYILVKGKQIKRRAIAPYNFVELPEQVVEVLPESLPEKNLYYSQNENYYSGRIHCTLTTESPLYTRCGLTTQEFSCGTEAQDLPDFFYTSFTEKYDKPVIPGSSLRGMLRNLVEIITFSKVDPVSDNKHLFFRAVGAPKQDSLGEAYRQHISANKVEAGYLKQDKEGWYIQKVKENAKQATFAWVKEISLSLDELIKFDEDDYKPQYVPVSYRELEIDTTDKAKRLFALDVDRPDTYPKNKAVLVTSGNMKQGNSDKLSPRRNHCVVFEADSNSVRLRIDDKAIEHYRNALTAFQKLPPFNESWGMLDDNCSVVFYCPPKNGNKVAFFGQSPNFRIPYSPESNGYATTVLDFIPPHLNDTSIIDLADAIFGWVKEDEDKKLSKDMRQRASRVFITDAQYKSNKRGIWYHDNPDDTITLQILSEPKPTCFQHYLVQPSKDNPQADKSKLKHYASQPLSDTVIRGHKLYWHKGTGVKLNIEHPDGNNAKGTQITRVKPINVAVKFEFTIYFENLNNIELGALLWVLDIAQVQDKQYRLKLGMGKPLGMGTVRIQPDLYLSDRKKRYGQLFNSDNWETGEKEEPCHDLSSYKEDFEKHLLKQLHNNKAYRDFQEFNKIPRIEMLLSMLTWEENPSHKYIEQRRYMEIGREIQPRINDSNEYKERPVLPNPIQVVKNDNTKINDSPPSKLTSSDATIITKPILRSQSAPQPIKRHKQSGQKNNSKIEGNNPATARPPKPNK